MSFHACPLSFDCCLCMHGSINSNSLIKQQSCSGFHIKSSLCGSLAAIVAIYCRRTNGFPKEKTRSLWYEICLKSRSERGCLLLVSTTFPAKSCERVNLALELALNLNLPIILRNGTESVVALFYGTERNTAKMVNFHKSNLML